MSEESNNETQNTLKSLLDESLNAPKDPREINNDLIVPELLPETIKPKSKKKRQCSNCTCSRSKVKAKSPDAQTGIPPKSGCGNCSLGDAFRCEGCIYKGMPAFKEGEEFKFTDTLNDL